jgi:hypothetical protein
MGGAITHLAAEERVIPNFQRYTVGHRADEYSEMLARDRQFIKTRLCCIGHRDKRLWANILPCVTFLQRADRQPLV